MMKIDKVMKFVRKWNKVGRIGRGVRGMEESDYNLRTGIFETKSALREWGGNGERKMA